MPHKNKPAVATPAIESSKDSLERLVPGPITQEGRESVFRSVKKPLIKQALEAELGIDLEAPNDARPTTGHSNPRHGRSAKTILAYDGPVRVEVLRDRPGTFEPERIPQHERRLTGLDETIVSMYAEGLTALEIQEHLSQMYGSEVTHEFISKVTHAVMAKVTAWQRRPLEAMYPVVFFDALRVKIREDGLVRFKAMYLALGVLADGSRDILGVWIENTEGATFWMEVFHDLRTRGVGDILIAVTDGLSGLPDAMEAVFPAATLQTCIVHLIRNSLGCASWKDRKGLAAALTPVYTAPSAEAAEAALETFAAGPWGERFPMVAETWRCAWGHVVPFFAFPPEVRRIIYTTNAIESVHARLRKTIKTRGRFTSDEAATKLVGLALRSIIADWARPSRDWKAAENRFAIFYEDRFTLARP